MTPNQAFSVVIKQAVLEFLVDMQTAGDSPETLLFVHPDSGKQ
jgi:hypothetical protein